MSTRWRVFLTTSGAGAISFALVFLLYAFLGIEETAATTNATLVPFVIGILCGCIYVLYDILWPNRDISRGVNLLSYRPSGKAKSVHHTNESGR